MRLIEWLLLLSQLDTSGSLWSDPCSESRGCSMVVDVGCGGMERIRGSSLGLGGRRVWHSLVDDGSRERTGRLIQRVQIQVDVHGIRTRSERRSFLNMLVSMISRRRRRHDGLEDISNINRRVYNRCLLWATESHSAKRGALTER